MRKSIRQSLIILVCCLLLVDEASAFFNFVFDGSNFGQTSLSAANSIKQVANTATQIKYQYDMLNNQLNSLKNLSPELSSLLTGNLKGQMNDIFLLSQNVQGMDFRNTGGISNRFDQLFPGQNMWGREWGSNDRHAQQKYRQFMETNRQQLRSAHIDALKSQALIKNIERSNEQTQEILQNVNGTQGEVQQLQAINQQLANLTTQINTLISTLVVSERSATLAAAKAEAESIAMEEADKKFWSLSPGKLPRKSPPIPSLRSR